MANQWLAFMNGVIAGPYSTKQIVRMYAEGVITERDRISREGEMVWKTIFDFDEFLETGNESAPALAAVPVAAPAPKPKLAVKKKSSIIPGKIFVKSKPELQEEIKKAVSQFVQNGEINFKCPGCGQSYSIAPAQFKGQKIKCQVCSVPFVLEAEPGILETATAPVVNEVPAEAPPVVDNVDFTEEVPEGDITCPHCWKTFSKENVRYISCHPDLLGDPICGEFEQKRFVPTVYHSNGLPLDARGMACTDMACPHCHLRIPASIVDLSSIYFSIAGAPSSGKSYFLTSMIHTLRKSLPENNLSFYDVDPVINSVLNGYEDTIFLALDQDSVVSLPKTQQIGGDFSTQILKNGISFELPKPFIFRLQTIHSTGGDPLDRNVVFYDNAGEHFQPGADTVANPATTHLAHSDGIVFLFDPLNDANMRRDCDKRDPQTALNTKVLDQTTLFAEMVNRIRRHGNLTSGQTTDIPLIIAVGKYDTWKNLLPCDVAKTAPFVSNTDDFSSELDWNTVMDVSFKVRELMLSVAPALIAQAEAFFKKVIFVPVSSFGCLASKAETGNIGIIPAQLNPIWVDVPVALLLAEKGVFRKNTSGCEAVDIDPSFVCKVQNGQIIFRHPVNDKKVSLPEFYEGTVLEIGGKKYKMPQIRHESSMASGHTMSKKSSIWG